MKRRLAVWILVLALLFPMLTVPVSAVPFSVVEDKSWVLGCDYYAGTQGIMKYKGNESNVTIPRAVRGYGVLCVYDEAFKGNTKMKTLTVPDGVTIYGLGGCNVKTIHMSEKSDAATAAFANCKYLTKINIPKAWQWIPNETFIYCESLPSIELHDGITEIGNYAFEGCKSLSSITLPKNLEKIGRCAFMDCDKLKTITIPKSVTTIQFDAFGFCDNLEKIIVEPGNKYYSSDKDGNLYHNGEKKTLVWASTKNIKNSYEIAADVEIIGGGAFIGAKNLKTIRIPETVDRIGICAFLGCTNLKEIWLEGGLVIAERAFDEVNATVHYPGDYESWTEDRLVDYCGKINWVPYCSGKHIGPEGTILTESTCAVEGTAESVCNLCGEGYTYSLPLKEHSYGEWVVAKEATCTTEGQSVSVCAGCGDEQTCPLPLAKHQSGESQSKGNGYHSTQCVNCTWSGDLRCDMELKEVVMPATCTEFGEAILICNACGYERTETLPLERHDLAGVQAGPSQTDKAMHARVCRQCGQEIDEWCDWVETQTDTTPTTQGRLIYDCTECGNHREQVKMDIYRISGDNRFDTAFKVADQMKASLGVEKFDAVIVASGTNFADALSGSYLAAVKNAPILLSFNDEYNNKAKEYIRANLTSGGMVYILGGENAVPVSMEEGLEGFTVKRLAGTDRFGTNLAILEEAGVADKDILVCTGLTFADSLSASASERPILLVWKDLTEAQQNFLENLNGNKLYVIGGESAVSKETEEQVAAYGEVTRVAGGNRFETSVKVAETFFEAPTAVVLAYAWNFPDGLCGGALAATLDVPLVLTMNDWGATAIEYAKAMDIQGGTVLGGTNLIDDYNAMQILLHE